MILAIDFDGVIHDPKNKEEGKKMGRPIMGAVEALTSLKNQGHTVVIHTIWGFGSGSKAIEDWLRFFKIPFDRVTNVKPQADYYIDDKAIKFEGWDKINL